MDSLRVAMIGAGAMASRHLEVLKSLPDLDVVGVSSRGAERLEQLAKDFDITQTYRSNDQLLKKTRPDAVVVAVSVASIFEVTMLCIKRGIPCLLEKPPGLRAAHTEEMLKASARSDSQYMVGLNRRFYSVIQNAKKFVDESGGLVSLLVQAPEDIAAIRAMNLHPPEVLDNWMTANGIHCIDLFRFLGGEVASILALSSASKSASPECFGALIRFDSGTIGNYVSNWTAPGSWQITLFGFNLRIDLGPLEEGRVVRRGGSALDIPRDDVDLKYKPGFYAQDKYFVDRVRQGAPIGRPAANLQDALYTMRLVETIAHSKGN